MNYETKQQFVYFLILAGIVMLPFVWGLIKEIINDWECDTRSEKRRSGYPHRFDDYEE